MITRVRLVCLVRIRVRSYLGAASARRLQLVGAGGVSPSFALRTSSNSAYLLPLRQGPYSCSIDYMFLFLQRGKKLINLYQRISSVTEGALASPLFNLGPTQLHINVARARIWQAQCPVDSASMVRLCLLAPIDCLIAVLSTQVVAGPPPKLLLVHLSSLGRLHRLPWPRILSHDLFMRLWRCRPNTWLLSS